MDTDVLVLERDTKTASEIRSNLRQWDFGIVESASVSDALDHAPWTRLGAVIADVKALTPHRRKKRPTEAELRVAIGRLREASERLRASGQSWRPLVVIVTSDHEEVAEHAAAVKAGADLYLPQNAAVHEDIMRSYLSRMLRARADDPPTPSSADPTASQAPSGWMQVFDLPDKQFRGDSGRLDASRIAAALGVPLKSLATALEVGYTTVHKTPDSPALQAGLAPFASVLAMLDQVFDGDSRRVLAWLQSEQHALGNRTPRDAMLVPGGVVGVEQFVAGAWIGEPD